MTEGRCAVYSKERGQKIAQLEKGVPEGGNPPGQPFRIKRSDTGKNPAKKDVQKGVWGGTLGLRNQLEKNSGGGKEGKDPEGRKNIDPRGKSVSGTV